MVSLQHPHDTTLRRSAVSGQDAAPGALLVVFVVTLLLPISFELASIRLSPDRLFLLISVVPFALRVISGQAGRFTVVDLLFLMFGVWIIIALTVVHGTQRIPFAGITAVELVGGYFAGRILIGNAAAYKRLFKILLIAILCLLPFAIYENFTGKLVIPDLLSPIFDTPHRGRSAYGRWGLERVYVVFDHPILWGLFCAVTLANFIVLARGNMVKILLAIGLTGYATLMSLSSAPMLACGLQMCLLAWGWIMGGRWKTLMITTVVGYVAVDLLSNRTPVQILIDTLTFQASTGYTRIAIFDAGWAAVLGSPIVGIGFNDWARPHWLTSSVDNFWLLTAMQYGLVGAGLLACAFILHLWLLGQSRIADPEVSAIRVGHAVALAGIAFTMVTVHVWGSVSVFVMFYVGTGAWMYVQDHSTVDDSPEPQPSAGRRRRAQPNRYTRFPSSVTGPAAPYYHTRRGTP